MPNLVAACGYFLVIHFVVSGTGLRDVLVSRLGTGPYRGAFALASLVGLGWMIYAYRRAPSIPLWGFVLWVRPAAYVLVFVAFLFVVIGLATPSPTRVGMESKLADGPNIVRGMLRITRHPFLWGVALWALVHLIVNGFLPSLILFGSLLLLSVLGTISIDAKRQRVFKEQWAAFARVTSDFPFAAIIARRNQLAPALAEIGMWRLLLAIIAYGAAFYLHGRVGPPLV